MASQHRLYPHPRLFLALRHAAEELLGHLQRAEAITSLRSFHRRNEEDGETRTSREAISTSCSELESALLDFSLFGYTDRVQLSEYLGLLALFIWAEIQAED